LTLPSSGPLVADGDLTLRPPATADLPRLVAAFADPEVARISAMSRFGEPPYGDEEARAWLDRQQEARDAGRRLMLAIAEGERLVGTIEVDLANAGMGRGELGYWVMADSRNRGVARRAIRALAAYAFAELNLARVEMLIEPHNPASCRAAEAAGFTREGLLRSFLEFEDQRHDLVMYSLLPGD
jgi:[ribosomal protein S5]-alanine N-acetyltransferase